MMDGVSGTDGGDGSEPLDAELEARLESLRPRLERMLALRMHPGLARRMDPADVIQDVLTNLVRRAPRPPDMDLYLWLRLEVGERLVELHRKHLGAQRRDLRREGELFPEASSMAMASAWVDGGSTPSQHGMREERAALLRDVLETMKPIDREVIALRHFEEATNLETARILGLSEQAASVRYVRALQRLRGKLGELGLEPPH